MIKLKKLINENTYENFIKKFKSKDAKTLYKILIEKEKQNYKIDKNFILKIMDKDNLHIGWDDIDLIMGQFK